MITAPCRSTMTSTVWFRNRKVFGNLVSRSTGLREKSDRPPPMSWFPIRWAQNSFHPQQCQFMAMLTFWFFYEGIRVRPFQHKYLTAATVTFCAAYLSWEGSAFILPALILALLIVRWGEWWWLKEFHL